MVVIGVMAAAGVAVAEEVHRCHANDRHIWEGREHVRQVVDEQIDNDSDDGQADDGPGRQGHPSPRRSDTWFLTGVRMLVIGHGRSPPEG